VFIFGREYRLCSRRILSLTGGSGETKRKTNAKAARPWGFLGIESKKRGQTCEYSSSSGAFLIWVMLAATAFCGPIWTNTRDGDACITLASMPDENADGGPKSRGLRLGRARLLERRTDFAVDSTLVGGDDEHDHRPFAAARCQRRRRTGSRRRGQHRNVLCFGGGVHSAGIPRWAFASLCSVAVLTPTTDRTGDGYPESGRAARNRFSIFSTAEPAPRF